MELSFMDLIQSRPIVPYIRIADYAVRQPKWIVPNRKLLDYLLIYIQEGHCQFEVDGRLYDFYEGDFCLIQPGSLCVLKGITATVTPYAHFDLFYHPDRARSLATLPGMIDLSEYMHLMQPRLNDLLNISIPIRFKLIHRSNPKETLLRIIGLWQNGDALSVMEANHLLENILLRLLKEFSDLQQDDHSLKPQSLGWITTYFNNHISETLSLQDMARRARLSPSRFNAVFKEKFGVSPHRYFLYLRIEHAQELLKQEEYTLEHIAEFCGFNDAPHFANAFKKIAGITPGQFRKELHASNNESLRVNKDHKKQNNR